MNHNKDTIQYAMADTIEVHPVTFPPEVLARISPDLSLQRHLSLGIRPCLRSFEEFRSVHSSDGGLSRYSKGCKDSESNNILGSNVLRSGKTFVVTSITAGIIEETVPVSGLDEGEERLLELTRDRGSLDRYGSVYPVVEVERGRVGAPTDEEMILSQKLRDCVLHSGIIPKTSLAVNVGIRATGPDGKVSVLYPDQQTDADDEAIRNFRPKRRWSYVLYAKIQVFSRSGPLFDMCWNSLMYALQSTQLPRAFIDERATDLKIPVRTRGRSATIRETYDILCDAASNVPLVLNPGNLGYSSSFGVIDLDPEAQLHGDEEHGEMQVDGPQSVLLADLESEAEETSVLSTVSIVTDSAGRFKNVSIVGGGSKVTPEVIRRSVALAKARAADLTSHV